ncbi:5102_t:CDS:2 [Entrophospora sp. SA101]|nr:5102_t:CDS:2 [Entrophospora sp. SA101]
MCKFTKESINSSDSADPFEYDELDKNQIVEQDLKQELSTSPSSGKNMNYSHSPYLYVAPELAKTFKDRILTFTTDSDGDGDSTQCEYDKSIDIWSFGIVNYYMLSQKYPWNVNNHAKFRERKEYQMIMLSYNER